ncbi:hypothetical protein CIW54_22915 [Paraburkholderia sp. T12-10]|nr:hypothetical protein CIW54_22915 [Paraburkholderia sp. T12-10]
MGSLSIWHWLIVFPLLLALYLVPAVRILRKAGYSGWLSLVLFVPLLNLIMYWVFAFVKWPLEQRAAERR